MLQARIGVPRVFPLNYAVGLTTPRVRVLSGNILLATLELTQSTEFAELYLSAKYTPKFVGHYVLSFEHDVADVWTVIRTEALVVSTDPATDIEVGIKPIFYLDDSEIGDIISTVTLTIIRDDDVTVETALAAAYSASESTYKAQALNDLDTEGGYTLLWYDDAVLSKVQFLAAFIPSGEQFVTFFVADNSSGSSVPYDAVDVLVSSSTGVRVKQGITDAGGSVSFTLPPDKYIITIRKGTQIFSKNNQRVEVTNTALKVSTNNFPFITETLDPTWTEFVPLLDICMLTATFHDFRGIPLRFTEIFVQLNQSPQNFSGIGSFGTTFKVKTDANGYVEFEVLQGIDITVSLMTHSWSRQITVPSEVGPVNLIGLTGNSDDVFDIIKVNIPDAPRRAP